MRPSRSVPASWMVVAYLTCFSVRLPGVFSASIFDRISRLLSGVRSSCDILARNSDFASLARSASILAPSSCDSVTFFEVRSRVTLP